MKLQVTLGILILFSCLVPDIEADTVAYWRFEEGAGTIVADGSGNGNTGTLVKRRFLLHRGSR